MKSGQGMMSLIRDILPKRNQANLQVLAENPALGREKQGRIPLIR